MDGYFENSDWEKGNWEDGDFINSIWEDGTWEKGRFRYSIWKNGIWNDGLFDNSTWEKGDWEKGKWLISGLAKNKAKNNFNPNIISYIYNLDDDIDYSFSDIWKSIKLLSQIKKIFIRNKKPFYIGDNKLTIADIEQRISELK